MLLGGDIGAGEAYMDGLWSSPDLPALLELAALNREALALPDGWWRLPRAAAPDARASRASQHEDRQPPEHRRALRPGQRLLPPVPRRDHDLLERRLRPRRTSRSRTPSATSTRVMAERAGLNAGHARPRDRHRLGRLRAVCRRRARLPRDDDHDLAGAARPGDGTGPRGRSRRPGERRAARLPRDRRAPTTPSSRSRCSRLSAPSTSPTFFEACDRALRPGGRLSLQVDHLP